MPIVKVGLAIRQLDVGQQLSVEATDPAFEPDLNAWARKTGHRIVEFQTGAVHRAVVEKCA